MKIAIVGSRGFDDYEILKKTIINEFEIEKITGIVSGGALGADLLAEKFAIEFSIQVLVFKPDWKRYGKGAGKIRNKKIIENCDYVLAFWDGISKGTHGSILIAKELGKPCLVVNFSKNY